MLRDALFKILISCALAGLFLYIQPIEAKTGPNSWSGADFRWCLSVFQAYWDGVIPEPYSKESLLRVLRTTYGVQSEVVMPIAYLPTAILLLRPFGILASSIDPALLWNGFCLSLLGIALLRPGVLLIRPLHVAVIALLFSKASIHNALLGQTAFLGAALLCLLLPSAKSGFWVCLQCAALLLLSIKPSYFLLGLMLALLGNNRKSVLLGLSLTTAVALCVTLSMPRETWPALLHNLNFFSSSGDSGLLSAGIERAFSHSLTLRQLLLVATGPEAALPLSSLIFLAWLVSWAALSLRSCVLAGSTLDGGRSVMKAAFLGTALLFFPYLGFYEELLMIPLILAVGELKLASSVIEAVVALALVVPAFLGPTPALPLVGVKCLAIGLLLLGIARRHFVQEH